MPTSSPDRAAAHLLAPGVAIVTGGAGGIGLAIVRAVAAQGVDVAVWDLATAPLDAARQACRAAGVRCVAVATDVADPSSVQAAAARTREQLGIGPAQPVRYAVNVAGIDDVAPAQSMSPVQWRRVIDVNLSGVHYACQAQHALMTAHRRAEAAAGSGPGTASGVGGAIVNIASMSARIVNRGVQHAHYCASKAAVVHLSRELAVQWVDDGIRVNSVSPGYTRTAMTDHNPPERNAEFCRQVPMGRMAEVDEIAGPVVFLLSDLAAYVTAHDLVVDGGCTAW